MAVAGVPRPTAHWPMTVLLAGFPVWWALGLASVAPLLVALPMAHQLLGRRPLRLPRGFGLQSAEPSVGYVFRVGAARPVRAQHEVPLASGLGIGLLAGVARSASREIRGPR